MPEPIEYRIIRDVQAALRGITVAGGYHHDVAALAVKLDPNADVERLIGDQALRPFVILELDPDQWEYQPAMEVELVLPGTIHAVHDADVTVDESWLRTFFRLGADVEQAIAQDITRGGLAFDTRIVSRQAQPIDGRQVWAMVGIEIEVRRRFGAPNG